MSCANKTSPSLIVIPTPASVRWNPPMFMAAIVAIVGAFQEALELRRAAHRGHAIDDE